MQIRKEIATPAFGFFGKIVSIMGRLPMS